MLNHSAQSRDETPHPTNSTTNTISDAVRRRAQSLINDRTIEEGDRGFIRYALATNDAPGLAELVRRADAGEPKHVAFTRCGELNCYGMVDAQIAAFESELLVN